MSATPTFSRSRLTALRAFVSGSLLALAIASILAGPASAGVEKVKGKLGVGYARLFISDAPGGSLVTTAALSYPLRPDLAVGPAIAFNLLGSRVVERGSQIATVDYTALELALLLHWKARHLGPIALVSVGPELVSARSELSTTGGGAAFSDLAVEEVAPGVTLGVTMMSKHESPVRVGFELTGSMAFLSTSDDWSLGTARLVFNF